MFIIDSAIRKFGGRLYLHLLVDEYQQPQLHDTNFPFYEIPKDPKVPEQTHYFRIANFQITSLVHDVKDETGYGGATFKVAVYDPLVREVVIRKIKGPWSTGPWAYNKECVKYTDMTAGGVTVLLTTEEKTFYSEDSRKPGTFYSRTILTSIAEEELRKRHPEHKLQYKNVEFVVVSK